MASLRPSTSVFQRAVSSGKATCQRAFSGTTTLSARNRIPPESPAFINVPTPPQTEVSEEPKPFQKGHLPIPRAIFERRYGERKTEPNFISRTAPKPSSEASQKPPASESQAWRRKMADARRQNLEEGIQGLWARKRVHDTKVAAKEARQIKEIKASRRAADREVDRLTLSTIPQHTLDLTVRPDPQRYKRAEASRRRTTQVIARKRQQRLDALQELYMHARNFITSEKDLEAKVDKIFTPDYFKVLAHGTINAQNAWDIWGNPMTLQKMSAQTSTQDIAGIKPAEKASADEARTMQRQLKLAEELTGGKMDDRDTSGNN